MSQTLSGDTAWLYKHKLKRTAVHESGHVLLAILEGCQFEDVILRKEGNGNAMVRTLKVRPRDDEFVRISLAGIMAARMVRHYWGDDFLETAYDDLSGVAEFARSEYVNLEWNFRATASYLENNWGVVEATAMCLIRRKKLTHDDCLAIFKEVSNCTTMHRPPAEFQPPNWQRLMNYILWRIKFPGGQHEALESLLADLDAGGTGEGINLGG